MSDEAVEQGYLDSSVKQEVNQFMRLSIHAEVVNTARDDVGRRTGST